MAGARAVVRLRRWRAAAAAAHWPWNPSLHVAGLFGDGLKAADCDTTLQMTERQSCDVELLCKPWLLQSVAHAIQRKIRHCSHSQLSGSGRKPWKVMRRLSEAGTNSIP